jgi:hypothetical protein
MARHLPGSNRVVLGMAAALWMSASAAAEPEQRFSAEERAYWAFQKLARPSLPAVRDAAWVRNPIDRLVLARLEAAGIAPGPEAGRIELLRRASLDLTGLPPAPEEIDAFLADGSAAAFERAVERLLASPRYGERWARHWLDLARFAESEGFKSDEVRPHAWRYRDYVIRSFNEDKPYDRFLKEQIAGDELWPEDPEARIATGFNRHYPDESNARNLMQRRQEILDDITDTTGAVFLGLTYGCARCHDHKFDPIPQADYYRFQAFFANLRAKDDIVLAPAEEVEEHGRKLALWEEATRSIREALAAIEEPQRRAIIEERLEKYPEEIQVAVARPPAERTPSEWLMYYKAEPYLNPETGEVAGALKGEAKKRWEELRKELERFASLYPGELPRGIGMQDAGPLAPQTSVLAVGIYDAPMEEVEPGFLTILATGPARISPLPERGSTGRRAALAEWLASPENPLTARVLANRIWHYHFGRGIVATPSDFGSMGEAPTHPELLDWLAGELIDSGWSVKALHRLILGSATYRQSSRYRAEAAAVDPENRLLWRFPRRRLEAEVIRDAALEVSGLLNPKGGGPSVFPELPPGMPPGGWRVSKDPAERQRRSIYIFVRRNQRYPLLDVLDLPDTHESCGRRHVTTTAPQALFLLNSELSLEWARSFAGRVQARAGACREARIREAYRLAYSRPPRPEEMRLAEEFFERQAEAVAETFAAAAAGGESAEDAVLADFCHVLLNSNEFVYLE